MWRWFEIFCFCLGSVFILTSGWVYAGGWLASQTALTDFDRAREKLAANAATGPYDEELLTLTTDQTLWSKSRKIDYVKSLDDDLGTPEAVLKIPSLALRIPVFQGTDKAVLNRGVGRLIDTAPSGTSGNIVIAGHRDSFFRPLKNIGLGNRIELMTLTGVQKFQVKEIFIVDPLDTRVLEPTTVTTLTLVTCYPFYYVGYAPERYIVRAELEAHHTE